MEVNLFRRNTMNATLCLCQQAKGAEAEVARTLGEIRADEQAANLCQVATVLMFVVGRMFMFMTMLMIVMMMIVVMLNRSGRGGRLMQLALDHDVNFGGLNAAPVHPGDA
jgi:hypothetical protein